MDMASSLSHRVEFRNLWNKEGLFDYQEYARRYMSPYTSNKSLLLFHSLGSGKTLTCISISIDHYEHHGTKTVIITKSIHGHYIFTTEIAKYKTMHGDFPSSDIFSMNSYIEFHNRLKEMTDQEIRDKYSNTIIIMDEIHNIKYQKVNFSSVYQQLIRLITLSDESRLILSTATPMTDNVEQIESILRLFATTDFSISYNAVTQNVARSEFHGASLYDYFYPIVTIPMSRHQQHMYEIVAREKRNNDVYRSLSQISLFCSLNGDYGRRIMKHMMTPEKITKRVITHRHKEMTYTMYRVREEYIPDITDYLDLTSCKYHYLLEHIQQHEGTFFVFIEDVLGSGIMLLCEILRHHGYELYIGDDITRIKPQWRFTFCVGTTDLCPNMEDRIEGFNHPLNKNGDYVKIIIGSRVLGESITLKNVRHFHCIIPHWNDSIVIQALGRVLRSKCHDDLPEPERCVQIHIYCATLSDSESIDVKKIRISNTKQSKISRMIDTLKGASIELIGSQEVSWYYVDDFIRHYLPTYIPMFVPYLERLFAEHDRLCLDEVERWMDIDPKITRHVLIKCIVDNVRVRGKYMLRTFRDQVFLTSYDPTRAYITADHPTNVVEKQLIPLPSVARPLATNSFPSLEEARALKAADLEYLVEHLHFSQDMPGYMKHIVFPIDRYIVHTLCYTKHYDVSYKAAIPIPSIPSGLRVFSAQQGQWVTCPYDVEYALLPRLRQRFATLFEHFETNHGIYGIISTIDMNMRVSLKITETVKREDRRMKHRGRMLSTLTKIDLYILDRLLADDHLYRQMDQAYRDGKRYKSFTDIYPYNDWIMETNTMIIRRIEKSIIHRGIFTMI